MLLPKNKKTIFNKKYLLISHTYTTGPSQELRNFFIKNRVSFAFVENPFSYNQNQKRSKISYYEKGKLVLSYQGVKINGSEVLYFIKDFFETLILTIKIKRRFDICITANPLNTTAAWFLKKFGLIKKIVFWTIDYTPQRLEEKLLNNLYHSMDRFCCYHSDFLWNSSGRMRKARQKNGVDLKRCARETVVVDGCHFNDIKRFPDEKINRYKLVFMGHLIPNKGVDLILKALPEVVKNYPKVSLKIIGTGPEENNLKKLAKELKVDKRITFTGYIKDYKVVEKMIASCGIAIAPYVPDPNSFTFFSDVGKVKIYLACGLPVLITDVPEIAKEIAKNKAGLIFDYQPRSLVTKMGKLLSSSSFYSHCRKNAIQMAQNLDWDNVFNQVLKTTDKNLWN